MHKHVFHNYHGETIIRIDKREARRAFNAGETIVFCPVNYNVLSGWGVEAAISRDDLGFWIPDGIEDAFDWYASRYQAFNCCHQLGYYLAYYAIEQ